MFKNIISALTVLGILSACQNSDKMQTSESGLQYQYVTQSSDGATPNDGEILILNMTLKTSSDSTILEAMEMPLQKSDEIWSKTAGGIEEGFSMLSLGDSLVVKLSAKDLYERTWRRPVPPQLDPEEVITCSMGLTEILDQEAYQRREAMQRIDQINAYREQVLADNSELMAADGETIDTYLTANKITAQTTETGLRYVILEEGEGPNAQVGDVVKVHYVGNVLDGEYFDTSYEEKAKEIGLFNSARPYGPYEFVLGTGGVIHGWDEAITLLNKGAKAQIYIPSPMGYGEQARSEIIVPNSILEFEVQLVDFVQNNE